MFYLTTTAEESATKITSTIINNSYTDESVYYNYRKRKASIDNKTKEILINDDDENLEVTFFPFHEETEEQNVRLMVCGKSGSGKSTTVGRILDQLAMSNPRPIVIFSFVTQDKELDRNHCDISPVRVDLSDEDAVANLTVEMFNGTVCVFDDVERSPKKKLVKFLLALRDSMFEYGRHHQISIISISHDVLLGNANKCIKSESKGVYLFPLWTQKHQTTEFLSKYVGLDKEQIALIMNTTSRWVYISMTAPTYFIDEKRVMLLI
jgi:Cdc6-like AAA superfamily ATPase